MTSTHLPYPKIYLSVTTLINPKSTITMKKYFQIFIIPMLIIWNLNSSIAQDYRLHSGFMYHFTKYIEWPAAKKSGDFVIGVVGNAPISDALNAMAASKTVGTQKIVIKKFSNVAAVSDCQILFLSNDSAKDVDEAASKSKSKNYLLVTESNGLAKKGACINFVVVDGKLKFELSKSAVKDAGLKVSSELLGLAIVI